MIGTYGSFHIGEYILCTDADRDPRPTDNVQNDTEPIGQTGDSCVSFGKDPHHIAKTDTNSVCVYVCVSVCVSV